MHTRGVPHVWGLNLSLHTPHSFSILRYWSLLDFYYILCCQHLYMYANYVTTVYNILPFLRIHSVLDERWLLSRITAQSLMVRTPINLVRGLIRLVDLIHNPIWTLLSVDRAGGGCSSVADHWHSTAKGPGFNSQQLFLFWALIHFKCIRIVMASWVPSLTSTFSD